jgi:hypothetical protein
LGVDSRTEIERQYVEDAEAAAVVDCTDAAEAV